MKLTDLQPRLTHEEGELILVFLCPKCCDMYGDGSHHSFRIPVGKQYNAWTINTEDFNTLTLRPSVLDKTANGNCGIHFYITKGEVEIL